MNVLLVDDDVLVLRAIQSSINWAEIGIDNCYTALSVEQAKRIITDTCDIQILVSDIEMPHENAFVLLDWIKEEGFVIQEILLTMYAEFEYAKRALSYNCFSYVLKPLDMDVLANLIREAQKREMEELESRRSEQYGKLWVEALTKRKEYYFRDLAQESEGVEEETYGLPYGEGDVFRIMEVWNYGEALTDLRAAGQGMTRWESLSFLRNSLKEAKIPLEAAFSDSADYYCAVLSGTGRWGLEEVRKAWDLYLGRLKAERPASLGACAFLSDPVSLPEMKTALPDFERKVRNALPEAGEIWTEREISENNGKFVQPDWKAWQETLKSRGPEALAEQASGWLSAQKGLLGPSDLSWLTGGYMEMILSFLRETGVEVYDLKEPVFSPHLRRRSSLNLKEARMGMRKMAEIAVSLARKEEEGGGDRSILGRVKQYIREHPDEDLTRESLAGMVYLNPDYLARVFKKETGQSIGAYIQEVRLSLAERRLRETDDPINLIAADSGYENFSYFARLFKVKFGKTPKDYRRDCRGVES